MKTAEEKYLKLLEKTNNDQRSVIKTLSKAIDLLSVKRHSDTDRTSKQRPERTEPTTVTGGGRRQPTDSEKQMFEKLSKLAEKL